MDRRLCKEHPTYHPAPLSATRLLTKPCLQEFTPSPEGTGKAVSMGAYVRDVFLEQVRPAAAAMLHACQIAACALLLQVFL